MGKHTATEERRPAVIRKTIAEATAATAMLTGPAMAGAEASGVFQDSSRPTMVYFLSAAITIVGAMFTALMWFIKREHESITGGIKGISNALRDHTHALQTMNVNTERNFAELRGEVAQRLLIKEHGRSSARIHEKVNKLGRTLAFLSGKLGLPPEETGALITSEDEDPVT